MISQLPVLLCFDVEPDDKVIEGEADWAGFRPLVDLMTETRPRFETATGLPAHFTWFLRMDPQIRELHGTQGWAGTAFARELQILREAGDEIGLHVHPWKQVQDHWVSDFGEAAWIEHCLRSSFEAYENCFGTACQSFRFGDRWMSLQAMELLEKLGARYDLTIEPEQTGFPIEPYMEERFIGEPPDYRGAPRSPYYPSSIDYRVPGEHPRSLQIQEIPISTALNEGRELGTLYLAADAVSVCKCIDQLIADETTSHLALPARTDVVVRSRERQNLERILEHLLRHPDRHRLRMATPRDALR
jgi:hypothetical protein